MISNDKYSEMLPRTARKLVREGKIDFECFGMSAGFAQGNLAIVPREHAFDFLLFCNRNPKACAVIDVTEMGGKEFRAVAKGSDVTTDFPRYDVWLHGEKVDECTDIRKYWSDDLAAFLIGGTNAFEPALAEAGLCMRHSEEDKRIPIYISNIPTVPAGPFSGPVVVSMIPVRKDLVSKAVVITSRFTNVHRSPVHIGDPAQIGIRDLGRPVYGDAVEVKADEVPVFWACGLTPQSAIRAAKPSLAITHHPGCLMITDILLAHLYE